MKGVGSSSVETRKQVISGDCEDGSLDAAIARMRGASFSLSPMGEKVLRLLENRRCSSLNRVSN